MFTRFRLAEVAACLLTGVTAHAQLQPLAVVDASGSTVGRFESGYAFTQINGVMLALPLMTGQGSSSLLWAAPEIALAYPTVDCSGPGYTASGAVPGTWPLALSSDANGSGARVFIADSDVYDGTQIKVRSRLDFNVCVPEHKKKLQQLTAAAKYSSAPVDLSSYVTPFKLQ